MCATGKLFDSSNDFVAVQEELVAYDCVGSEHNEQVALDHRGMGISSIGRADDRYPLVPNRVLRRFATDLMFLQQLLDQRRERLRHALFGARWLLRFDRSQIADESFGEFAELMRPVFLGHHYANIVSDRSRLRQILIIKSKTDFHRGFAPRPTRHE
jgi:hypothetical protein